MTFPNRCMSIVVLLSSLLIFFVCIAACNSCTGDHDDSKSQKAKGNAVKRPSWGEPRKGTSYTADGYPKEVLHSKTGVEMVYIPAGTFLMGTADADLTKVRATVDVWLASMSGVTFEELVKRETPQHEVRLTKAYYLSKTEITNGIYKKWKPSHHSSNLRGDWKGNGNLSGDRFDGDDQPVVSVSWNEATAFCDANDLRLPTEAEWEYAARAGTTTIYPWGDDFSRGKGWANILDSSTKRKYRIPMTPFPFEDGYETTAPVGRFRANAFELYDMIGNVCEWCADRFDVNYYAIPSATVDPRGPAGGEDRVVRGGSWLKGPFDCRVASRAGCGPSQDEVDIGFRVARDL